MSVLLTALVVLFVAALAAGWLRERAYRKRGNDVPAVRQPRPDGCCGQHEVCEKESLLAGVSKQVEYYDDEELDAFRGRPSDGYSPAEVEAFEEILYTMRAEEVAGWVRSLQLRGVELPDALKDEVVMIVTEVRERAAANAQPAVAETAKSN